MKVEKSFFKLIDIDNLVLWKENVRFSEKMTNEEECIKALFDNKTMNRKQKKLLDAIFLENKVYEDIIVYRDGRGNNIVLDGNRRISLFKIVNYPELLEKYKIDIEKIRSICTNIKSVECKVYYDFKEACKQVELRHLDEQDGKGIVKWNAKNKDRMRLLQGYDEPSLGFKIMEFYKTVDDKEFGYVKKIICNKSTIDRIFDCKYVYSEIFGLNSKKDYDLKNHSHQSKINEILEKFYDAGGKVGLVYKSEDIKELLKTVEPLKPTTNQLSFDNMAYSQTNLIDEKKEYFPANNKKYDNQEKIDNYINSDSAFETLASKKATERKNNSYVSEPLKLFDWKSEGLSFNSSILNNYLYNIIYDYSKYYELIPVLAPYFYRLLLDISIRELNAYIITDNAKSKLKNNFDMKPFGTTSDNTSVVNSNKIISILLICNYLRTNEYVEEFSEYKSRLSKIGISVNNQDNVKAFVNDLNSVVHGSVENLPQAVLEKYDVITLNLLKIMSKFIKLK